jgi:hypothetical protein
MTAEEVTFCNLVSAYVGSVRYAVLDLQPAPKGQYYTLRLHQLGAPESQNKQFTVFADDLIESVRSNQLREGLRKDLERECGVKPDAK